MQRGKIVATRAAQIGPMHIIVCRRGLCPRHPAFRGLLQKEGEEGRVVKESEGRAGRKGKAGKRREGREVEKGSSARPVLRCFRLL